LPQISRGIGLAGDLIGERSGGSREARICGAMGTGSNFGGPSLARTFKPFPLIARGDSFEADALRGRDPLLSDRCHRLAGNAT
jgi:hypothetical protein